MTIPITLNPPMKQRESGKEEGYGSSSCYWKPVPQTGGFLTMEITVCTQPPESLKMLSEAGTLLDKLQS